MSENMSVLTGAWTQRLSAAVFVISENPNAPKSRNLLSSASEHIHVAQNNTTQQSIVRHNNRHNFQVTRAEFEELCADLWPRVSGVVQRAIAAAGGAGSGARLVLAGGGSRVPAAMLALKNAVGHDPARSINADEAATMGAVYR